MDHLLAKEWNSFSPEPLDDFSKRVYGILLKYGDEIPGHFTRMAAALVHYDWFGSYRTEKGLSDALERLNYRSSRTIPVYETMNCVQNNLVEMEDAFQSLMTSQLQRFGPESS